MLSKKQCLLGIIFWSVGVGFAAANEQVTIPDVLRSEVLSILYSSTTKKEFVDRITRKISRFSVNGQPFGEKEIEQWLVQSKKENRERKLSIYLKADADGDGVLSKQEFNTFYTDSAPSYFRSYRKELSHADTNLDGAIDANELKAIAELQGGRLDYLAQSDVEAAKQYLLLDQDGDNRLSLAEVQAFATAIFNMVDKNGDEVLSAAERKRIQIEEPLEDSDAKVSDAPKPDLTVMTKGLPDATFMTTLEKEGAAPWLHEEVTGIFTLSGKRVRELPPELADAFYVAEENAFYRFDSERLLAYGAQGEPTEEIPLKRNATEEIKYLCLGYDDTHHHILVYIISNKTMLYRYNLKTKDWTQPLELKHHEYYRSPVFASITYDPLTRSYIGNVSDAYSHVIVVRYDEKGRMAEDILEIIADQLPGFKPEIDNASIQVTEKYIIIINGGIYKPQVLHGRPKRVYLYDRSSKTAALTWATP